MSPGSLLTCTFVFKAADQPGLVQAGVKCQLQTSQEQKRVGFELIHGIF